MNVQALVAQAGAVTACELIPGHRTNAGSAALYSQPVMQAVRRASPLQGIFAP